MKALTVRQPWASLIAVGAKRIETLSWSTKYRGRLLIHAGRALIDNAETNALAQHLFRDDEPGVWKVPCDPPMARGAVVASATLTDCIPIVDRMDPPPQTGPYLEVGGGYLWGLGATPPDGADLRDQLRFGDFTPGRYALLLDDVKPTTERCPRCWGEGSWTGAMPHTEARATFPCSTCKGRSTCDPVPMKGRQGLWVPEWDTETTR